jgi:hypothetical protein
VALRAEDRSRDGKRRRKQNNASESDDDDGYSAASAEDSAADSKDGKARCFTEPEKYLYGREAEVERLKREDRETGYMHTHPVTQERIRAAEAAAKAAQ